MTEIVPFYFGDSPGAAAALLALPPAGAVARTPVILCPPWGWDEVASYRSRRRWAEALAEAGHPTLRFCLPGTGDSAGAPRDASLLDSWVDTVAAGVAGLRSNFGPRVAAIGLGLGGLIAREAIARGVEIDDLVLWAAPAGGRVFARETLAFARMQEWAADPAPEDGGTEAGGFLLGSKTSEALRNFSPVAPANGSLSRALLLDRDGTEVDAGTREALEGAGVQVQTAAGAGWGTLVSHPERSRLPLEVVGAVESWLRAGETPPDWPGGAVSVEPAVPAWGRQELRLGQGDEAIVETPLAVEQEFGRAFGILASPVNGGRSGLCAVFLNAGAVRHTGPNRMWVEAARRWAASGVSSLRVDLEAIGEADGDESRLRSVPEFYTDRYEAQVERVLDALQAQGLGNRFILVGLCAGGFWSFRAAQRDRRIGAAVLVNAGALIWHDNILGEREVQKLSQARQWSRWKKLLSGRVGRQRLGFFLRSLLKGSSWRRRGSGFENDLDRLRDAGVQVTLAFSKAEPLAAELDREGVLAELSRWPNVSLRRLPGSDHTLRPLAAQRAVQDLLDEELQRFLAQPARQR